MAKLTDTVVRTVKDVIIDMITHFQPFMLFSLLLMQVRIWGT